MAERKLSELLPGDEAVIRRITQGGAIGKRLADMGIVKGNKVYVRHYALLKDPIQINIGYDLALRRAEANYVIVDYIQKNENEESKN